MNIFCIQIVLWKICKVKHTYLSIHLYKCQHVLRIHNWILRFSHEFLRIFLWFMSVWIRFICNFVSDFFFFSSVVLFSTTRSKYVRVKNRHKSFGIFLSNHVYAYFVSPWKHQLNLIIRTNGSSMSSQIKNKHVKNTRREIE